MGDFVYSLSCCAADDDCQPHLLFSLFCYLRFVVGFWLRGRNSDQMDVLDFSDFLGRNSDYLDYSDLVFGCGVII